MANTIDLPLTPEALEKLTAEAAAQGVTVEVLINAILAEEATRIRQNP